ncbi:MAG: class I adenylate-forming enzyme family protein [Myxococcota bacterium]|nr:class I adenylate-forming enzyme family protein [Myxococcota bacterium]
MDMNVSINNRFQEWLRNQAQAYPDKDFIYSIDQESSVTYGEADRVCRQIGQYLRQNGFVANDRVAIMSNNSIEHLLTYIGVMAYGATACTIHVEMNALYIDEIIETVKPRIILFEEEAGLDLSSIDNVEKLPLGQIDKAADGTFFGTVAEIQAEVIEIPVNIPADIASIFYTSGTSSKPKGVMCNFSDLFDNTLAVVEGFDLRPEDRILDFRSFNWVSAQVLSALAPLAVGATLLLARKFSSSRFFNWVKDCEATITAGNPTTINMLINRPSDIRAVDIPHLRYIISSSAPLLVQDWQNFEKLYGVKIAQGYGASEVGWISASNESCRKRGSVGKPLPYQKLTIVDGDGKLLPALGIGNIELGPSEETEFKYLGADGEEQVSAKGRVQTGDMGYYDEEGFLFISGRQKDLIIRSGINISPLEIENVISELNGVAEVAAFGLADEIYGEAIAVAIVLQDQCILSSEDVINHCQKNLSAVKIPEQVNIIENMPKTDRGKLDRKSIKELWSQN